MKRGAGVAAVLAAMFIAPASSLGALSVTRAELSGDRSQFSTSTLPTRTMWWRVRAQNAAGVSAWSSSRRVEVKS